MVVTSDTAPQRRMLADAALYVPPGDAKALADALLSLAADRTRVDALATAARQAALERFTPAAIVEPLRARLS